MMGRYGSPMDEGEGQGHMSLSARLHSLFVRLDGIGGRGMAAGLFGVTVQIKWDLLMSLLRELAPKMKKDEYEEEHGKLMRAHGMIFGVPKGSARRVAAVKAAELSSAYLLLHDVEVDLRRVADKHHLYDFRFSYSVDEDLD